ncbi:hypothetical protein CPAR01_09426 [Colletotrichum paranaense]|uniref:Uncharacterized protein n=1 Tax=Colletotrichum paranaense TaxID=1914294 RepID=A0ABQ9SGP6_9PEZI|nr:uncharacterized protein CPAR01_09426 [Colletotrichum paranaense]KAK1535884.1 hypothetical protein CPAR01_09426 [Colletotrichum paranaense]
MQLVVAAVSLLANGSADGWTDELKSDKLLGLCKCFPSANESIPFSEKTEHAFGKPKASHPMYAPLFSCSDIQVNTQHGPDHLDVKEDDRSADVAIVKLEYSRVPPTSPNSPFFGTPLQVTAVAGCAWLHGLHGWLLVQ